MAHQPFTITWYLITYSEVMPIAPITPPGPFPVMHQHLTRWGYGFVKFSPEGNAIFTRTAQRVKLYEKLEDAKKDFLRLDPPMFLRQLTIIYNGPQVIINESIVEQTCKS
jgi:hypothetical protein